MSSEKISLISMSLGEHFNWSESCCSARYLIVQPGSMLDGKWQWCQIINTILRPMRRIIYHEGSCHVHTCLNSMLSMSVLMMSTNF